ncbi:LysR family transcriptional regulator [Micromonospora sp. PPF5-17]|uniref:LysR family transcriptional regulator n=1 Tax=Micromonospora solifontis TaxID=2487138 RepID=A0ABX9WFX3_9ACTN|nr:MULTISPECIES: LysR substrate-binding domain-containing protein [Micromonospora]NES37377.1 LysR family transcriptional regulator [Micromonospora solifontis]NES58078.1 LysR family transcriptional regulator [Micromonospora sp. PPF5-6]RNL98385.1 LysR family transcriptional regulator [Micromonospora solifontis]
MPLPPWISDLPALDLLLSVAQTGSVGRAAQAHGITQPSASARLAKLERRLGVPLLVRSRRGSFLTPAGETVVVWSRSVIDAAQTLADGVLTLRADRQARLRIAASLTVAEYLLPAWLLSLRRTHPELDISADVANSNGVVEAVRSGAVDLGFVESPDIPAGLTARIVGEDRLTLVVAASYPLAAHAWRALRPTDLADQPLLLREPGSGTRHTFLSAMEHALGFAPSLPHAISLGSTTTILSTVCAGGGIGVISARAAAPGVAAGELVELRVENLPLTRPLHALWLGRTPAALAAELLTIAAAASAH